MKILALTVALLLAASPVAAQSHANCLSGRLRRVAVVHGSTMRMRWRVPMRIVRKTNMRSSEQAFLVAKNRNPMYIKGPQNQC